jgi:hypothetical protein
MPVRPAISRLLILVVAAQLATAQTLSAAELTDARFQQLHKELQPGDEPWLTIPWKIALLNAQQIAAKEDKPIFIWAMDGHPLGCT